MSDSYKVYASQDYVDSKIEQVGDSSSLNWRGEWSETEDYSYGDLVFYDGSAWIFTDTASNPPDGGGEPSVTSACSWSLFTSKGEAVDGNSFLTVYRDIEYTSNGKPCLHKSYIESDTERIPQIGDIICNTKDVYYSLFKIEAFRRNGDILYCDLKALGNLCGKNGTSVTHSWNGTTLTVTSASGTSSSNLKGDKGTNGASIWASSSVSPAVDPETELYDVEISNVDVPDGREIIIGDLILDTNSIRIGKIY